MPYYEGMKEWTPIIVALITIVPTTVTVIGNLWQNSKRKKDTAEQIRIAEKNAAKASIENAITRDILRTEILCKMPIAYDDIMAEYEVYHANGGNGKVTREVEEYKEWYNKFEESKCCSPIKCCE